MKLIAAWIVLLVVAASLIIADVRASYTYKQKIGSYWSLADKSSTIQQKAEYIDQFVAALDESHAMYGHNAIIFTTPDNDLQANMQALRSLQNRLHEIKGMDVTSFAYQQAIQQITSQEQGEAHNMLTQFSEGWCLHAGYWYVWGWIEVTFLVLLVVVGVVLVVPTCVALNIKL